MMLHDVVGAGPKRKYRVRVGRGMGSGLGESCGRGQSGAYSRSGNSSKLGFEGGTMRFFRRLPRRGFNNAAFRVEWTTVNLGLLEKAFNDGDEVTVAAAIERGVVRRNAVNLKVLGDGALTKKLRFPVGVEVSNAARAKIVQVGGTVAVPPKAKLPPNFRRIEADKKRSAKVAAATPSPDKAKGDKAAKGEKADKPAKTEKADKPAKAAKPAGDKKAGGGDKKK
ncbi:MAG: 50S ribosomal protein L15 [Planctomycetes bacterium]|nr:50S ribosomal protein L15 [Planctomycetota bacterium]